MTGARLLRLMRSERPLIAAILAAASGSTALVVLGPALLGHATDLIFAGVVRPGRVIAFRVVGEVMVVALCAYAGSSVLGLIQLRLVTTVVQRTVLRLREQTQDKLTRLPLSYFDRQPHGEILSRVTNDIDNLAQTLQQTFSQIITSLLAIIGVLAAMFVISPLLALVAVTPALGSAAAVRLIGKRAQPQFAAQWSATGRLNAHIEEVFTGHSLVKAFGQHEWAREVFAEHNEALSSASFKAQSLSGAIQPTVVFLGNLSYVFVAIAGALRVASGALSLGDVQAFIQYSRQFSQPTAQVASMASLLQSGIASAERVFALLDAGEEDPDPACPARPARIRGEVEFQRICFRYAPDIPLIENLSMSVRPGQTVAIVGPTGAGKTTLVNLLMRFGEVSGGRILLDGTDIAAMTRTDLRTKMGMVLQEPWLFGGTIAENIAYADPGAARDRILQAARATYVDRFVRALPRGYDTVIDDELNAISAGEKQLITIARAFLADPAVLILDEATSSVDTRTELLVQQAMTSLRKGRTSFVIAHRLATIREADVILVMQSGRIVEKGRHHELLAAGGAYADLHAAQFARRPG